MAATELVARDIEVGEQAFKLFQADFVLRALATFWWYYENAEEWRFAVVTHYFDDMGQKKTYARIQSLLRRNGLADALPLKRVVAMSPKDPIVTALARGPIRFSSDEPMHIVLRSANLNGFEVSGAYVYSMMKRTS